jgi:hypothetical protein
VSLPASVPGVSMRHRLLSIAGAVAVAACQFEPPSTPLTVPPPTPSPAQPAAPVLIRSFGLSSAGGSVRAPRLGWTLNLDIAQRQPGLFVRVDLEFGPANLTNACYASEVAYSKAFDPQTALEVQSMGFVAAERLWPGFSCDWRAFQPTLAAVRVFGAADPLRLTPVASGRFPVSITVTE